MIIPRKIQTLISSSSPSSHSSLLQTFTHAKLLLLHQLQGTSSTQDQSVFQNLLITLGSTLEGFLSNVHSFSSSQINHLLYRLREYNDLLLSSQLASSSTTTIGEQIFLTTFWRLSSHSSQTPMKEWERTVAWKAAFYAGVDGIAMKSPRLRGDGEFHLLRLAEEYKHRGMLTQCYEILQTLLQQKHVLIESVAKTYLLTLDSSSGEDQYLTSLLESDSIISTSTHSALLFGLAQERLRSEHTVGTQATSSPKYRGNQGSCTQSGKQTLVSCLNTDERNAKAWKAYAQVLYDNQNYQETVDALQKSIQYTTGSTVPLVCTLLKVLDDLPPNCVTMIGRQLRNSPAVAFLPFLSLLFSPHSFTSWMVPLLQLLIRVYPQECWHYLTFASPLDTCAETSMIYLPPLPGHYVMVRYVNLCELMRI